MNYIGSKLKLCQNFLPATIKSVCGEDLSQKTFCDIFAGTGIVSQRLKSEGYAVISNDVLFFSYVLNRGALEMSEPLTPMLRELIDHLNHLTIENCTWFDIETAFIYQNYSPHDSCEDTVDEFVGTAATTVDIIATVATLQAADMETEGFATLGRRNKFVVKFDSGVNSASAADAVFALVFVVEVEEDVTLEPAFAEASSTSETRLLVDSDKGFKGGMLQFLVLKDGKDSGHADTIVSAKSGAVGSEPSTIQYRLDRVFHKVELLAAVLFANHIHVGLEADHGALLVALAGGLSDEHVSELVAFSLKALFLTPVHEVGRDTFLVLGGTRNLHDFAEIMPHACGL